MDGDSIVGEKHHLLVVDDADGVRDVLAIQLGREGHAVSLAGDAKQALGLIGTNNFDLILLDIKLPGMSGLELLKQLRQSRTMLDTPIIVISGNDQTSDVVTALRCGANDYVTKPFDLAVVTARVRTQLSLRRAKQVNDRFLKVASHDLKKPLLVMLDVAREMRKECAPGTPVPADGPETLSILIQSGEYMQRIIEDLLELRAVKEGHMRLVKLPTDIGATVRQAVTRNTPYAKTKEIELRMQFETGLTPIMADDFRILQVLENLVGNAIKFGPAGSLITVRTRSEPETVVCEVIDNGPGLPEEEMGKLFLEYSTLSNRPTGGEKSTGLGLSICKELVALHGGEIGARNNPGGGSTFWFRLPLA
jgi:signal transduction histidine kinase